MRVSVLIVALTVVFFSQTCRLVETNSIDPSEICLSIPGLTGMQVPYCKRFPWIMNSIERGLQSARKQCGNEFSNYAATRWNCSTVNSDSVFKPILRAATKEAAFAWAITAAGVVAGVARDCRLNALKECGCRRGDNPRSVQTDLEGCSDDIEMGTKHARKYIQASLDMKKNVDVLAAHNTNVGRRVVRRIYWKSEKKCKCHGVSGSCTLTTCWREVPDMKVISDILKRKYRRAKQVKVIETDRKDKKELEMTESVQNATPKQDDMVFEDDSPTYCRGSRRAFYVGTVGRACNATSALTDGCRHLCCGRGYDRVTFYDEYACHCKFTWCCKVVCQTCTKERVEHLCKA